MWCSLKYALDHFTKVYDDYVLIKKKKTLLVKQNVPFDLKNFVVAVVQL